MAVSIKENPVSTYEQRPGGEMDSSLRFDANAALSKAPTTGELLKEIEQRFPEIKGMRFDNINGREQFQVVTDQIKAKYPEFKVSNALSRAMMALSDRTDSLKYAAHIQADLLVAVNGMRAASGETQMDLASMDVDQDLIQKSLYRVLNYNYWETKAATPAPEAPKGSVPSTVKGTEGLNGQPKTQPEPKQDKNTKAPVVKVGEVNPTFDPAQKQASADLKAKITLLGAPAATADVSPEVLAQLDAGRNNLKALVEYDVGYALGAFQPIREKYGSRIAEINTAAATASNAAEAYDAAAKANVGKIAELNQAVIDADAVTLDGRKMTTLLAAEYSNAVKSFFDGQLGGKGRELLSTREIDLIDKYLANPDHETIDPSSLGLLKGNELKIAYNKATGEAQDAFKKAMTAAGKDTAKQQAAKDALAAAYDAAQKVVTDAFNEIDEPITAAETAKAEAEAARDTYTADPEGGANVETLKIARDAAYAKLAELSGGTPPLVDQIKADVKAMRYDDAVAYQFDKSGIKYKPNDIEILRSAAFNGIFADMKFAHDNLTQRMSDLDPAIQKAFKEERALTAEEMKNIPANQKTWAAMNNDLHQPYSIAYKYTGKTGMVLDSKTSSIGPRAFTEAMFYSYSRLRIQGARENKLSKPTDYDVYSDASLFNRIDLKHANTADGRSFGAQYNKEFRDRAESKESRNGLKDEKAMAEWLRSSQRTGRLIMDQSSRTELQKLVLPERIFGNLALLFTVVNGFQQISAIDNGSDNSGGSGGGGGLVDP